MQRQAMLLRTRYARGVAAAAALFALLACREGPEPFEAVDRPPRRELPLRLTFSLGDDRSPSWSPGGDTVYYTAQGFDHLQRSNGVLVAVAREGGITGPILQDVQSPLAPPRWLTAASRAPDAGRIAYAEVWLNYWTEGTEGCRNGWQCTSPDTAGSIPALGAVMCRVRGVDAVGRIDDDPAVRIDFAGRRFASEGAPPPEILTAHPFQFLYSTERSPIFRPSWSPDGERLVVSDGQQLLVWRVGDAQARPIPGTAEGVQPAWSPDGAWIAYTYLERGDSRTFTCICPALLAPSRVQERTVFEIASRVIRLVRPDGSEQIDLIEGDDPAWTPDGSELVFRAQDRLWRIRRDGSGLAAIPGTEGGREPAVSPDGRLLAFARRAAGGNHDIWIVAFDAQP